MCPLFLPGAPIPLVGIFSGECASELTHAVPAETLRVCCNRGYARVSCEKAAAVEQDAARFLVQAEGDGWIEVAWATERDHHPVAVGTLRVETGGGAGAAGTEPLERQARAFASAYLRQKGRG